MNVQQQSEKKGRSAEGLEERRSGGGGGPTKKLRAMIPPDVFRAVADSQFLTTTELGRLLLLTSKELTNSAFSTEGSMWRSLCLSHLGIRDGTTILGTLMAEPLSMSAEQCFRRFVMDLSPKYNVPRPLKYEPKDYLLMVAVRDKKKDQPIFSEVIHGRDIPEFFDTGDLEVTFEELLSSKTIKNAIDADGHLDIAYFDLFKGLEWELSVRIFRYPDQETIDVVKTITDGYKIMGATSRGQLYSQCSGMMCLKELCLDSAYGHALLDHCFRDDRHDYKRIELELDPVFRYVACKNALGEYRNATIGISGFTLSSHYWDDKSECGGLLSDQLRGKDVTFAHFLEASNDWFTP